MSVSASVEYCFRIRSLNVFLQSPQRHHQFASITYLVTCYQKTQLLKAQTQVFALDYAYTEHVLF